MENVTLKLTVLVREFIYLTMTTFELFLLVEKVSFFAIRYLDNYYALLNVEKSFIFITSILIHSLKNENRFWGKVFWCSKQWEIISWPNGSAYIQKGWLVNLHVIKLASNLKELSYEAHITTISTKLIAVFSFKLHSSLAPSNDDDQTAIKLATGKTGFIESFLAIKFQQNGLP